jgi:hypothetical protein
MVVAKGQRLIGNIRPDNQQAGFFVRLTWRIGFRGPNLVKGMTEREVCEKLQRMDPSVRFHSESNRGEQAHDGLGRVYESFSKGLRDVENSAD